MKTTLKTLALLTLALPAMAFANPNLVGTWKSEGSSTRALPGVLELKADGAAKLAPDGFPPLVGTWKEVKKGTLSMEMPPHGSSQMDYVLKKDKLTLKYNDGFDQEFSRETAKDQSKKPKK